jgi:hypothetical protein
MIFEALTRTGEETHFFLRDDDIDVVEETLVTLLDICGAHRVPITLAAIPGKLTGECAALIRERRFGNPNGIEVHQHGWMHASHEREGK